MNILKSCAVALAVSTLPQGANAASPTPQEEATIHPWGVVDTQGLEALLGSKVPLRLVDARTDKWFDGTLIQGAERLPADASNEVIKKTLPNKQHLVVVYCFGESCPASKNLATRLVELGYSHVIDYHLGIQAWTAQQKPTQKI